MDTETLLTGTKWKLLQQIAQAPASASELSKQTATSIAHVGQQIKLLEAYQLIKRHDSPQEARPGKPLTRYCLADEFATLFLVKQGFAARRTIKLDKVHKLIFNILFLPNEDDHYFLERFCYQNEEILSKCLGLAFLKSTKDSVELLYLTDDVEPIRKKYSNVDISYLNGKTKKVILWTHSEHELREGLERMEPYFVNLFKNPFILLDTDDILLSMQQRSK